jgi:hypothetical protein
MFGFYYVISMIFHNIKKEQNELVISGFDKNQDMRIFISGKLWESVFDRI